MSLYKLYRRLRYGAPIVVVSGLPRSGTSMVMRMLEAGGIDIVQDGIRTADDDNPKGYYEHERVKALAQETDKTWLGDARGKTIKVISHLLKQLPEDNNYHVLFIRREMSEVLASQSKMLDRRAEENGAADDQMAELFEADIWRARYLLKNATHFDFVELHYTHILNDAHAAAREIQALLGRKLDLEKMAGVVDHQLYRNRAQPQSQSESQSRSQT